MSSNNNKIRPEEILATIAAAGILAGILHAPIIAALSDAGIGDFTFFHVFGAFTIFFGIVGFIKKNKK